MTKMTEPGLWLTVDGEDTRVGVPLQLLSLVFSGIQDTVYHIAMAESGWEVRSGARIPGGIRSEYQLVSVSEHNSAYSVAVAFAPREQMLLLPDEDGRKLVLNKYTDALDALSGSDNIRLATLFPNSAWRRRILRSIEDYCPQEGEQWHLAIRRERVASPVVLSPVIRERIDGLIVEPGVETLTVSGELVRVHLDEHRLGIQYQPTDSVLECSYPPELEELVVKNLRQVVHVSGAVQISPNGLPDKIVDVADIHPLDLRPHSLESAKCHEGTIVLKKAMLIEPVYEDGQVMLEIPDLHITACGDTREDAIDRLSLDLIWLWKEYAFAPREELSWDAMAFADYLRSMVEEASVPNG